MPTIFSHPAVPLALGFGLGREIISRRLLLAGVAASILPDLDVIAFGFGIPYEHEFGHRGSATLFFSLLSWLYSARARGRWLNSSFGIAFGFLFLATASHGVLDALTNGGLGIAFFWPWSHERYFSRYQVIEVSPIGPSHFFSRWGINVILSELRWVWLPCALMGLGLAVIKKQPLTLIYGESSVEFDL
jgi:inner membrane protein